MAFAVAKLVPGQFVACPKPAPEVAKVALMKGGKVAMSASSRKNFALRAVRENSTTTDGDLDLCTLPANDWPENFSILQYEDLCAHYEHIIFKEATQPSTKIQAIMSRTLTMTRQDTPLSDVKFGSVTGMPVVDENMKVIGVISKKDLAKDPELKGTVADVMSSPAITVTSNKSVADVAALMLKNKVHRVPVVNNMNVVVGMVTRTDIFTALSG